MENKSKGSGGYKADFNPKKQSASKYGVGGVSAASKPSKNLGKFLPDTSKCGYGVNGVGG